MLELLLTIDKVLPDFPPATHGDPNVDDFLKPYVTIRQCLAPLDHLVPGSDPYHNVAKAQLRTPRAAYSADTPLRHLITTKVNRFALSDAFANTQTGFEQLPSQWTTPVHPSRNTSAVRLYTELSRPVWHVTDEDYCAGRQCCSRGSIHCVSLPSLLESRV